MSWDPDSGMTFGEYMRGGLPLGHPAMDVVAGERTWRTRDQVVEGRTADGGRFKAVRDQLGHVVTRETTQDGRERQHVHISMR